MRSSARSLLVPLAVAALLLAGCRSAPDPIEPVIADQSTFLGLAVTDASRLEDPIVRADLYARIAVGYRSIGDEASMRSLVQTALQLSRSVPATEESVRVRLSLAPLLAEVGNDQAAVAALEGSLGFVSLSSDPRLRAEMLPIIVQSALRSGEAARPLLRRAVDEVYVIENPRSRAEALIAIARLYQAGDTSLSVTGLIQQAIPAVRSTQDPLVRALLFARLAVLASATNEARLARRLEENVIAEVEGTGSPDDAVGAGLLVSVIDELGSIGSLDAASGLASLLGDHYHAVRALVTLASHAPNRAAAADYVRRAADNLPLVRETELFVDASIRLGFAYAATGSRVRALALAQAAQTRLIDEPAVYSGIEFAADLAHLYVRLDELQAIRTFLVQAPDDYVRGIVAVRAAERLIDEERMGVAADFLTIALVASDEAAYLADGLRRRIAAGFARTASIRLAIRTIERIDDELLRALAVVDLAVVTEPAGLVTPIYRSDLASVLRGR